MGAKPRSLASIDDAGIQVRAGVEEGGGGGGPSVASVVAPRLCAEDLRLRCRARTHTHTHTHGIVCTICLCHAVDGKVTWLTRRSRGDHHGLGRRQRARSVVVAIYASS